jgi:hypothetical protein
MIFLLSATTLMKESFMASIDTIDTWKTKVKKAALPVEYVTMLKAEFPYIVVPPDFERPPGWECAPEKTSSLFAWSLVPSLKVLEAHPIRGCTICGVSSNIRCDFRPIVAAHSIYAHVVVALQHAFRCRIAGMQVPEEPMVSFKSAHSFEWDIVCYWGAIAQKAYAAMRVQFFEEYLASIEGMLNPLRLQECTEALLIWANVRKNGIEVVSLG